MAYLLTRISFPGGSTVWLPIYEPVDPLDSAGYTSRSLPLSAGGVFDPNQDDRLPRQQRVISREGQLIETSEQAIQDAYTALAVASGLRGSVYRQNEVGDRAEWIRARVMVDAGSRVPRDIYRYRGYYVLDITVNLELQEKAWHGLRHGTALTPLDTSTGLDLDIALDDTAETYTLTSSPQTLTLSNAGNLPCDGISFGLTAGSADVTAFGYTCGEAKATWTGLLKSGNQLIIDTANALVANQTLLTASAAAGATTVAVVNAAGTGWAAGGSVRLVLDDGTVWYGTIASLTGSAVVNFVTGLSGPVASGRALLAGAYSGFVRDANQHTIDAWARLLPGSNSMITTLTGGSTNSVLTLSWDDCWA